jgi:hypothetical protein
MGSIFTAYSPLLPDLSDDLAATYCLSFFCFVTGITGECVSRKNESLRADKHYLMAL